MSEGRNNQTALDAVGRELEQRIAGKNLELPMLPQVVTQVLSLINDEDSDAAQLTKLIQSDQALAGHVMRIANSAAYSPTAKMVSLQQAIARLGMHNIADISLAATMGPKMFTAPGFESVIKEIWLSSLATAVWAREISRLGRRNVESSFLCGLLYQIGRPVVLQTTLRIAAEQNLPLAPDDGDELMSRYQTTVGAALAVHWQLPEAVAHTIHGMNNDGPAEGSQSIVDVVKAARCFTAMTLAGRTYDAEALSHEPLVVNINLYEEDVQQLLGMADAVHDTIEALTL